MLKIDTGRYIEEDDVECICEYASRPVRDLLNRYRKEGRVDILRGYKKGFRTFILLEDGYGFLCHLSPKVYLKRCESADAYHEVSKTCYIRKKQVRQVISSLNSQNRRQLKKAKEGHDYINLAGAKAVTHYLFMKTGRIYGVHCPKGVFEPPRQG